MPGKMKFLHTAVSNIAFALKTSFLASKKYFALKCIVLIGSTAVPLLTMWFWKHILNSLSFGSAGAIGLMVAAYFFLELMVRVVGKINTYIEKRYEEAIDFYFDRVMIEKTSRIDLAYFDSAQMADKISRARDNFWALEETSWTVFQILSEAINVIITFVVVCTINVWIGVATVLLLIPSAFSYKKYIDCITRDYEYALRNDMRKVEYLRDLFLDEQIHFEMKLHQNGFYFLDMFAALKNKILKVGTKFDLEQISRRAAISLLNYGGDAAMLIYSIVGVNAGNFGIGDLQYSVSIVARLREQFSALIIDVNRFLGHNTRLNDLREFIELKPESEKSGTKLPSPNPKIEFRGVWFRYPNTKDYVLKNCSFTIEPNQKMALIGMNGSGKSTIIKLMFRFYDPEQGCITLDGTDIREYDIYALRKVFGVLFQEVVQYSLPLREIIALSDFEQRFDTERLDRACDISGVSPLIQGWESGYDTVLGRKYTGDGKDLSGGQWQLLGLARAYFKKCDYMVLDEPSAALDPVSEDRIFEQLYQLGKNKTVVMISHRFSNTTNADKILVIGDGHIVEQGSHSELLSKNGEYARLFLIQSKRYI